MVIRASRALRWIALSAACVAIAAALLYWQQSRLQAALTAERLDTARAVQALIERQVRSDLDLRAELIAGNQAFIGYVTLAMGGVLPGTAVDTASIVDLLEERRAQLGLSLAAVIDGNGQLIASRDRVSGHGDFARSPIFVEAVSTNATAHGLWLDHQRLYYVAMVPLSAYGSDAGFLLVGTALDGAVLDALADTADARVALFAVDGERTQRVSVTPVDMDDGAWLSVAHAEGRKATGAFSYRDGLRPYRGYVAPLFGSKSGQLLVLVPGGAPWSAAATLGLPMIVGAALGLCMLLAFVLAARRRVAVQADALARVLEHAATTGDYHLQVSEQDADPMAPVAAAFNRLMARLNPRSES